MSKWPNSWQKIQLYITEILRKGRESLLFFGKESFLKKALIIKERLLDVIISKLRTFV